MTVRLLAAVAFAAALLNTAGCIPYSVGATAQTIPEGQSKKSTTYWFMPNGYGLRDDTTRKAHTLPGIDGEARWGIDDESDFGLRIPSGSGIVASYKRRVAGYAHPDSAAVAWQLGAGLVNLGEHAVAEGSLMASSASRHGVVWYGGVRGMQVVPLSDDAVGDRPSLGGFFGWRIKVGTGFVYPEVAVYYDHSALGIRKSDVIYVPSLTLEGINLPRGIPGIIR